MQKLFVILPNNCILAKYVKMKKAFIKTIFRCVMASLMFVVSQALVSCMNDEEIVPTPECAITSFSVGSIKSLVTIKKYDKDGNATDTTVSRTIGGAEIAFNIDQLNGKIYNVEELPNWVNLTRVVPSFSGYGNVYGRVGQAGDSLFYTLSSGNDSIDFSKPVELLCVALDGVSTKRYTVEMRKSEKDLTMMEWAKSASNVDLDGVKKLFFTSDKVFAFAKNGEGKNFVCVNTIGAGAAWAVKTEMPISGLDCSSVVMFNDKFYAIDAEGYIYCSVPETVTDEWTKVSEKKMARLLCADDFRLYAYDGNAIVGSENMSEWQEYGTMDLDKLPETSVGSMCYKSRTNENISIVVMTGVTENNAINGVSWYKVSSADPSIDQKWSYMQVTLDNAYGLPRLGNLSVARSKGALYAIGTKNGKYERFYRSQDNGLTWHALSVDTHPMPEELNAANGSAVLVGDEAHLWIYQENGEVWEAVTL